MRDIPVSGTCKYAKCSDGRPFFCRVLSTRNSFVYFTIGHRKIDLLHAYGQRQLIEQNSVSHSVAHNSSSFGTRLGTISVCGALVLICCWI